jgi:multidrug resistance efflux pump
MDEAELRLIALEPLRQDNRASQLVELDEQLKRLRVEMNRIQSRLASQTIVSLARGRVVTSNTQSLIGQYFQAGSALVEIASIDTWDASGSLSSKDVLTISEGDSVVARLLYSEYPPWKSPMRGVVQRIAFRATASSNSDAHFGITVNLDTAHLDLINRDESYRSGMPVRLTIITKPIPISRLLRSLLSTAS